MKKIAIVGPENAGKSVLSMELASFFNVPFSKEFARSFLEQNGSKYTYQTLETIGLGQIKLQQEAVKITTEKKLPFCIWDTDMLVMKVWCEFVFNNCYTFILEELANNPADMYLLCQPNLPWVNDGLREYPDENIRQTLFYIYKSYLTEQQIPFTEINATGPARTQQATLAIQTFLRS